MKQTPQIHIITLIILLLASCDKNDAEAIPFQDQFSQMVQDIEEKRTIINSIKIETAELIHKFNTRFPNKDQIAIEDIFDGTSVFDSRQWLTERIQNEEDPSYNALIDEIVRLEKIHKTLTSRINLLQNNGGFSAPEIVQRGDSHQSLAEQFLIGWDAKVRVNMIDKTALWDYIEPGNHVYFATRNKKLFTCVMQGEAKQSPNQARRRSNRIISQKIARLTSNADSLFDKNITLQTMATTVQTKLELSEGKANHFQEIIDIQHAKLGDIERQNNSVQYLIGKKSDLLASGVISQKWLFFNQVAEFDSKNAVNLDLRNTTTIHINRTKFDSPLKKIKILPSDFENDLDYIIAIEDTHATVTFLDPQKFKREAIVILTN